MRRLIVFAVLTTGVLAIGAHAQTHPLETTIAAARTGSPALKGLLTQMFPTLQERGGAAVWKYDFLFAVDAPKVSAVALAVDAQPPAPMKQIAGSTIWYRLENLRLGRTHRYQFFGDGKLLGNTFEGD